MKRIGIITQARVSSSRLPGKILLPLGQSTALDLHLKRLSLVPDVDEFCVATTHEADANEIINIARRHKWQVYQGNLNDVLDRFYQAARNLKLDVVLRLTSDCPLIDPTMVNSVIREFLAGDYDYGSNWMVQRLPEGQSVEIMTFKSLEKAWNEAKLKSEREHVTPYIWKNSDQKGGHIFKALSVSYPKDYSSYRMTLDYQRDLDLIRQLVNIAGEDASFEEYMSILIARPELAAINSRIEKLEGYQKSLQND